MNSFKGNFTGCFYSLVYFSQFRLTEECFISNSTSSPWLIKHVSVLNYQRQTKVCLEIELACQPLCFDFNVSDPVCTCMCAQERGTCEGEPLSSLTVGINGCASTFVIQAVSEKPDRLQTVL